MYFRLQNHRDLVLKVIIAFFFGEFIFVIYMNKHNNKQF
jgi:hypothetical protein